MSARIAYYTDLLDDCVTAVKEVGLEEQYWAPVISALIQSDSYNGLRKAVLQPQVSIPPRGEAK
jgi:hypothetical protein